MKYVTLKKLARGKLVFLQVKDSRYLIGIDYGNCIEYYYRNNDYMSTGLYLKVDFGVIDRFFNII